MTDLAYATDVLRMIPHCHNIGMRVMAASSTQIILELPYDARLIGNPQTGVIHGGALTALMDTACGLAVHIALGRAEVCPTLDLRIDYMRIAVPGETLIGRAETYHITDNVVFTRGIAYQGSETEVVAHCVGTFMRIATQQTRLLP